MAFVCRIIQISLLSIVLISGFPTSVLGDAQFELGLGENRFFIGERFFITFKDVIYWLTGACIGLLFASTFIFISDYDGVMTLMQGKKFSSSRNRAGADEDKDGGEERDARLIGSKKYPTQMEERVLQAIHTEPDNYVARGGRQGRLIGAKRLPTGMEERMLTKLESPDNEFAQPDDQLEKSQPSAASILFKILFSLPEGDDNRR